MKRGEFLSFFFIISDLFLICEVCKTAPLVPVLARITIAWRGEHLFDTQFHATVIKDNGNGYLGAGADAGVMKKCCFLANRRSQTYFCVIFVT